MRQRISNRNPIEIETALATTVIYGSQTPARSVQVAQSQTFQGFIMLKKVKTVGLLVTAAVGGAAIVQRPEVATNIRKLANVVWSNVSTSADAQLAVFKSDLEESLTKFNESHRQIENQLGEVSKKAAAREEELMSVENLLARFKEEYATGSVNGFPRLVLSRSYTSEQMKQQVQKLLERQSQLQPVSNGSIDRLKEASEQVKERIVITTQHLENMPVYSALAIAGNLAGESDKVLNSLTSCLKANHTLLTNGPVREIGDLLRDKELASHPAVSADEFLAIASTPKSQEYAEEAPSIAELTKELRRFYKDRTSQTN